MSTAAQYLTFSVAGEQYGVGVLRVREVIEFEELTHVPRMPRSIRGVLNLRGTVVPVVDLAVLLGLAETVPQRRTCVVIVEPTGEDGRGLGILVDCVSQVVDFDAADIAAPPAYGTRIRADFLTGMGKMDKRFVLLLDLDRVLAPEVLVPADAAAACAIPATEPVGESADRS